MAEAPWRQAATSATPGATGHIPASRLKSDVSDRRVEPPLCVQNAMLTKDKKPFTYTPGGIDLSEIKSPRMARRLEMNAMNEGVGPIPQTQPNYPTGPLPPSALAAMNPQIQVQVFPTGGIPQQHHHHGGGPPPPPPPPSGIPPPPRAPPMMKSTSPVPLDSFERPDMTKIIPENPMAMLRKTSGPVVKRDPIFNKNSFANDAVDYAPPRPQPQPQPMRQPEPPQTKTSTAGLGSIYVPPVNQNTPSTPAQKQPQTPPFPNQVESPPTGARAPPAYYKRRTSTPEAQSPPISIQRQPPAVATPPLRDQTPDSPKPSLSKAPTPWLSQKRQPQQQDVPEWVNNQRAQPSPPVVQEQQKVPVQQQQQQSAPWRQQQEQQKQPEPPAWQQRQQQQQQQQQQQSETQPWQQRQQQQPEQQPWQQRQQQPEPQQQPWQQQQQQPKQPQSPPWQQQTKAEQSPPIQIPQGGGVRKQVQVRDRPQESGPVERTEVVIVNEPPQVFHHPGQTQRIIVRQPQSQNNNQQQQQQGGRIIPAQMQGASSNGHAQPPQPQVYVHKFSSPGATPTTPGGNSDARSLNRQLSWNSNPTQSNTFRVLQKITQTDGDDDDDQPVIEHSPKTPHNFPPQRQLSTEQVRKLKQNEGDQELMNKFKQGLNQDSSLHNEVDPRYRGPHIPSKAFKLLQSMTGGPDEPTSTTAPQGQQSNNRGPKVRTIPIQIEGDGPTKNYVPPSEQTVQEPKKYMGSSIPGRSFKMLQAMTAPDDCGPGQSDY